MKQELWHSVQLAPVQVTSSETVYWSMPDYTSASHLVNVLAAGHGASQPPFIAMCALRKAGNILMAQGPELHYSTCMHAHTCAQVCKQNQTF